MNLVERVQAILLKPKDTWPVIEQEGGDVASIYKNYLLYLAAIPAVAGFIGMSVVGMGAMGFSYRVPMVSGLVNMVMSFVLVLAMTYVLALVANALAPSFSGEKNFLNAFKLVAYGATAALVGGVFSLIPAMAMLGMLAGLYSIYLFYTGVPVLMKVPQDKAVVYTAVLIVCGFVAGLVIGALSAMFSGGGHMMGAGMSQPDNVEVKLPGTDITLDSAKIEAMGKQVEAASQKMEAAQATGDTAAAGKAMSEMMGAALGGGEKGGKPFSPEALQGFVPTKLGSMERTAIEARSDAAMGVSFSSVTSEFRSDAGRLEVKVQDIGVMPVLAMAMGAWAQSSVNRESQTEVEKVYKKDGVAIKEEYRKDGSRAEMSMLLANGVLLEVSGDKVNMDGVRLAMAELNVKGLSGLVRAQ